jgi:hypothetical protein
MELERVAKFKRGMSRVPRLLFCGGVVNGRVVERFLGASEEEKRRMQIMYGVKVLNKLIAAWEAEVADRGYLQENTVRASSLVVSSLKKIPFSINHSIFHRISQFKWFNTDSRRPALLVAFLSRNPLGATR